MKKAALQQSEERKITGTGSYNIDSSLTSAKIGRGSQIAAAD